MDPKQRRATVKRAADDLKGQRVLVIGDSVSAQWAAALALDLHGRGLFSADNAPLRQSVAGTPSHWCGAPNGADWVLQGASLHFTLASFSVRRLKNISVSSPTCPWEGDDLFAGMGPRHRSTVERVLREFQPSVIVANMGIHYDSREMNLVETDGEYARSLHVLFSLLTSYQASAPVRPNLKPNLKTKVDASRPPLVLFRETFPQHFWTERYDGSYFEQERASNARFLATLDVPPGACSASLWSERDPEHQARLAAVHDGPYAINRIARAVLSEYPSIRPLAQFNRMAQQPHMHVASVGLAGLFADLFSVVSTMLLGVLVGTRALGLEAPLAALIASGAAICGCSAVVAAQPVVEGEAHETAAAVGTVVACGTLAMFLYPTLFRTVPFLAANPKLMAIYTGSTVHELAGVVAASAAMGSEVSATAIVTKLVRVCLLAPTLLIMSTMPSLRRRKDPAANAQVTPFRVKTPLPWFALGFVGVAALNSVVTFDRALVKAAAKVSAACLAMAMAALGFDADLGKIRQLGVKPLLLATLLWAWLLFVGGGVSRLLVLAFP
ncbi:membrane protein [Chrysochromulina tobinii]|uniref:Membrane protein n=1 Tax=Chrysochromulina tobinii TaxID=1460289 RepID=A0A0M0JV82_9EUKA|nr:membrane protein [Chrysochromulina tobinii]|eukprot:KOO30257.1 membrane protein [Chrysochromulina sp. CCMP291]